VLHRSRAKKVVHVRVAGACLEIDGEISGHHEGIYRPLNCPTLAAHASGKVLLLHIAGRGFRVEIEAKRDTHDPLKGSQAMVGDDSVDPIQFSAREFAALDILEIDGGWKFVRVDVTHMQSSLL
jgi:hypothetical protein